MYKTMLSRYGVVRSIFVSLLVCFGFSDANASTIVVPAGGNIQAAINRGAIW